jgi:Flp pilus assembly protein TadD
MGNVEKAVERYALAVSRAPDDGGLYLNMGIAYHRMGDKAKSIELIGKAHTKLGSYVAMHNTLNMDRENAAYGEIDSLLRQASHETGISSIALATRSLTGSGYPLYWKRFHK